MSIHISTKVWAWSKAEGTSLLVLLALADHAKETGECWPGIKRLAKKCRVSERTVQRCIRELEKLGDLRVELEGGKACHGGRTNQYHITISPVTNSHPAEQNDGLPGDKGSISPVTVLTPTPVTSLSPKASVEPSVESSREPAKLVETPLTESEEDEESPKNDKEQPLSHRRYYAFLDCVMELRRDFTGHQVPPLTKPIKVALFKGLNDYDDRSLDGLLFSIAHAWYYWEHLGKPKSHKSWHVCRAWGDYVGPRDFFRYLQEIELALSHDEDGRFPDDLEENIQKYLEKHPGCCDPTPQ